MRRTTRKFNGWHTKPAPCTSATRAAHGPSHSEVGWPAKPSAPCRHEHSERVGRAKHQQQRKAPVEPSRSPHSCHTIFPSTLNTATKLTKLGSKARSQPVPFNGSAHAPSTQRRQKHHEVQDAETEANVQRQLQQEPGPVEALFSRSHAAVPRDFFSNTMVIINTESR